MAILAYDDEPGDQASRPYLRAVRTGPIAVADLRLRRPATVAGTLTAVQVRQWVGAPVLECTLSDGTGSIVLAFLGRRSIAGISPGREIEAEGTVGMHRGRRIILNPIFKLRSTTWE